MAFSNEFYSTVRILIKILPLLEGLSQFALKGGTAINLFYRNLPRLSVDIDLTYLLIEDRKASIRSINAALGELATLIETRLGYAVSRSFTLAEKLGKLKVVHQECTVKIEPNFTLRGCCLPPESRDLSAKSSQVFEVEFKVQCLSFEDLYAGKLCAALDRQHPRDLFDVKLLLESDGITERLRKVFLVYLVQSNRPAMELLKPNLLNITDKFESDFVGMMVDDSAVGLDDLIEVQRRLPELLLSALTDAERRFIISAEEGNPSWIDLGLADFSHLPGIKWKLLNLGRMDAQKKKNYISRLKKVLEF